MRTREFTFALSLSKGSSALCGHYFGMMPTAPTLASAPTPPRPAPAPTPALPPRPSAPSRAASSPPSPPTDLRDRLAQRPDRTPGSPTSCKARYTHTRRASSLGPTPYVAARSPSRTTSHVSRSTSKTTSRRAVTTRRRGSSVISSKSSNVPIRAFDIQVILIRP